MAPAEFSTILPWVADIGWRILGYLQHLKEYCYNRDCEEEDKEIFDQNNWMLMDIVGGKCQDAAGIHGAALHAPEEGGRKWKKVALTKLKDGTGDDRNGCCKGDIGNDQTLGTFIAPEEGGRKWKKVALTKLKDGTGDDRNGCCKGDIGNDQMECEDVTFCFLANGCCSPNKALRPYSMATGKGLILTRQYRMGVTGD
ncbi:hypothetical protein UY3_11258 [Chelonia mydas]|uniref:Uncharacterized protein n=1 Tax=Chelonia mydas TaxID=8469 RepID=M7BHQ9_CHEMY|nr:hypothetical protein UY3_11258 [Chelonia mydas]